MLSKKADAKSRQKVNDNALLTQYKSNNTNNNNGSSSGNKSSGCGSGSNNKAEVRLSLTQKKTYAHLQRDKLRPARQLTHTHRGTHTLAVRSYSYQMRPPPACQLAQT